jgi:hypothetical protein
MVFPLSTITCVLNFCNAIFGVLNSCIELLEPLVNVVNDLMLDMIGTILTTILLLGSILGVFEFR